MDNGITANIIITEVTGKNKTNINGIVEVAGQRVDLVMTNRNGIFVNGGGFLNTDRVTLTTGNLHMKDGDLVGIDNPDDLAGWRNSISINLIGGISGRFSVSGGTGGPASGTVTY